MRLLLRICCFAVSVLFVDDVFAEERSPELKRAIEAGEKQRTQFVSDLELQLERHRAQLEQAKKGVLINGKKKPPPKVQTFRNKADKEEAVAKLMRLISEDEGRIKSLKEPALFPPTINHSAIEVGDIGILGYKQDRSVEMKIEQVVDDSNMLVSVGRDRLWMKAKTEGFVDGKSFEFSGVIRVSGTRKYTTVAGGSLTVFVVEPFSFPKE